VHISVSHRVEIPATFAQTGHPFLDTRPMSHPKDSPWSKTSQKWLVCKLSRIGWGKKKFHCLFFIFFSGIVCGIHLIQLGFSCLLFVYITLRCKSIYLMVQQLDILDILLGYGFWIAPHQWYSWDYLAMVYHRVCHKTSYHDIPMVQISPSWRGVVELISPGWEVQFTELDDGKIYRNPYIW